MDNLIHTLPSNKFLTVKVSSSSSSRYITLTMSDESYSMATGIITKLVHNIATKMFTVITRRANTKKDAIPTPKFPVSQKVT